MEKNTRRFSKSDNILLCLAIFFVVADIVLALCLGLVLPYHLTRKGWFPANGKKVNYHEAVRMCPCIAKVYNYEPQEYVQYYKQSNKPTKSEHGHKDGKMDSFVVSLSYHCPEKNLEVFLCTGIIVKRNRIVAHKECLVQPPLVITNIRIRQGSSWLKSEPARQVTRLRKQIGDFQEFIVSPELASNAMTEQKFYYRSNNSFTPRHVRAVGWRFGDKDEQAELQRWVHVNDTEVTKHCHKYSNETYYMAVYTHCHRIISMKWTPFEFCQKYKMIETANVTAEDDHFNHRYRLCEDHSPRVL